jgi:hypothetical protein
MPPEVRPFLAEAGGHLLLRPDFTIAAVGPEYARMTHITSAQVVGRNIFDVFPDNPEWKGADGVRNLRISLDRVKETLEVDKMADQRYDIQRADPDSWEERWWRPANMPVLDENGKLKWIVHRVEDVTLLHVVERKFLRERVKNRILYAFAMVAVVVSLISFYQGVSHNGNRITRADLKQCELAASLQQIHALLSLPPTKAQLAEQAGEPPKYRDRAQRIVAELNLHLARYDRLNGGRPSLRGCEA